MVRSSVELELECSRPEVTSGWGEALGRVVPAGLAIGLIGELGAGKTLFAQGLARGLSVPPEVRVTSPTFTLVNEVLGGRLVLIHADLYRLETEAELAQIGLDEMVGGPGVVAIEWADRLAGVLGRDWLEVRLEITGPLARRLRAVAHGPIASSALADWRAVLSSRLDGSSGD